MGERPQRRHRVLIEDARRDGHHLRVTWHPGRRQFVLSTWSADTCTGAAQLAVEDVAELTSLLVDGLAEAAARPAKPVPAKATPAVPSKPGLSGLVDRLRWLVRGTAPGGRAPATPGSPPATVHPLRHRSA
jgi:hypothetical protein